jgi:hypothetical protein
LMSCFNWNPLGIKSNIDMEWDPIGLRKRNWCGMIFKNSFIGNQINGLLIKIWIGMIDKLFKRSLGNQKKQWHEVGCNWSSKELIKNMNRNDW